MSDDPIVNNVTSNNLSLGCSLFDKKRLATLILVLEEIICLTVFNIYVTKLN